MLSRARAPRGLSADGAAASVVRLVEVAGSGLVEVRRRTGPPFACGLTITLKPTSFACRSRRRCNRCTIELAS
jgi:hypothetical protein